MTEFFTDNEIVYMTFNGKIIRYKVCKNHSEAEKTRSKWVDEFWK